MSEKIYDEMVAPLLLQAAEICQEHKMPIVCAVEYAKGELGKTYYDGDDPSLAMVMIRNCAEAENNIDGFILAIKKYAKENGIDTSQSIFLNRMAS